ncbi:MAG: ATP-binding protein [Caldilineaceae bacterium]|nr:ATP-binding protein [Caldilineaceae bacterium]
MAAVDLSAGILRKFQLSEHRARLHLDRGEYAEAVKYLRQCHQLMQQYADQPGTGDTVRRMRLERAEEYLTLALQAESQVQRGESQPTPLAALPERSAENNHQATVEGLITRVNVRWADIGGLLATKEAIQLNYALGLVQAPPGVAIQPSRRTLLYGPPGTGKTMLAAAMSNELDATFFNARIPDLMSQYFGESSKLISALYATAAIHAPSVIFLDEIDALSRQRGGGQESGAERRLLNTFLGELDGLQNKREDAPFILTVGATNVPWELDRAILSRFSGGMIYVPLPDVEARRAILGIYLDKRGHRIAFGLEELVRRTQGYSGREMEQIVGLAVRRMVGRANPNLLQQAGSGQEALRRYQLKVEPLSADDIAHALAAVRPATSAEMVRRYEAWEKG